MTNLKPTSDLMIASLRLDDSFSPKTALHEGFLLLNPRACGCPLVMVCDCEMNLKCGRTLLAQLLRLQDVCAPIQRPHRALLPPLSLNNAGLLLFSLTHVNWLKNGFYYLKKAQHACLIMWHTCPIQFRAQFFSMKLV